MKSGLKSGVGIRPAQFTSDGRADRLAVFLPSKTKKSDVYRKRGK
ncbi:MAG: hypothetical protein PHR14_09750 [Oscillospiraceae bacterium]|nr:hypothetical protein [Oscillospiraceae bacterium]